MGFANAVKAYGDVANGQAFGGRANKVEPQANGEEFASLVRSAIDEAIKIGEKSEQLSIQGVNDKADLNQVVTAVAEAERRAAGTSCAAHQSSQRPRPPHTDTHHSPQGRPHRTRHRRRMSHHICSGEALHRPG